MRDVRSGRKGKKKKKNCSQRFFPGGAHRRASRYVRLVVRVVRRVPDTNAEHRLVRGRVREDARGVRRVPEARLRRRRRISGDDEPRRETLVELAS
jgi:hypothetical protein